MRWCKVLKVRYGSVHGVEFLEGARSERRPLRYAGLRVCSCCTQAVFGRILEAMVRRQRVQQQQGKWLYVEASDECGEIAERDKPLTSRVFTSGPHFRPLFCFGPVFNFALLSVPNLHTCEMSHANLVSNSQGKSKLL